MMEPIETTPHITFGAFALVVGVAITLAAVIFCVWQGA